MAFLIFTGANGFIASQVMLHFIRKFRHNKTQTFLGIPVTELKFLAVDLESSVSRPQFAMWQSLTEVSFLSHKDLKPFLDSTSERVMAVVHNGACSSTEETDPNVFLELNLNFSKMLWEYCTTKQVPYIYASSAGVYGTGKLGFSDKKSDCSRYIALSLYAKSKLDFDLWALSQTHTPPFWVGLRYFNVYGPGEGHKGRQASMVYHAFKQIKSTGKIKLYKSFDKAYKDGEQKRDFVYVKDIAILTERLLERACKKPLIAGHGLFLNIGTGCAQPWNALMREIFSALSLPENIEYIDMPETLKGQYQNFTEASMTSWQEVNVAPSPTSLSQGVKEYVDWLNSGGELSL